MPRMPVTQHQKTAPGPPRATAVETPMIFPVPSVAASVVESAENGDRFLSPVSSMPSESLIAWKILRCGMRSFPVK